MSAKVRCWQSVLRKTAGRAPRDRPLGLERGGEELRRRFAEGVWAEDTMASIGDLLRQRHRPAARLRRQFPREQAR
jgi:hypothetical protein